MELPVRATRLPRRAALAAVTAGVLILANPAVAPAHHSFAMFDTANPVSLTGTVTAFEWTNPHAYIELDVPDGPDAVKHWSVEMGSPSILMRAGWTFKTLKPGDTLTVVISPLRSGQPGGLLNRAMLNDGRVLGNGPPQRPSQ
jgi:hypothetical protein